MQGKKKFEQKLFKELQVNLAYRCYIGYDLDEDIPDHSIMTKPRLREHRGITEYILMLLQQSNLVPSLCAP